MQTLDFEFCVLSTSTPHCLSEGSVILTSTDITKKAFTELHMLMSRRLDNGGHPLLRSFQPQICYIPEGFLFQPAHFNQQ